MTKLQRCWPLGGLDIVQWQGEQGSLESQVCSQGPDSVQLDPRSNIS